MSLLPAQMTGVLFFIPTSLLFKSPSLAPLVRPPFKVFVRTRMILFLFSLYLLFLFFFRLILPLQVLCETCCNSACVWPTNSCFFFLFPLFNGFILMSPIYKCFPILSTADQNHLCARGLKTTYKDYFYFYSPSRNDDSAIQPSEKEWEKKIFKKTKKEVSSKKK